VLANGRTRRRAVRALLSGMRRPALRRLTLMSSVGGVDYPPGDAGPLDTGWPFCVAQVRMAASVLVKTPSCELLPRECRCWGSPFAASMSGLPALAKPSDFASIDQFPSPSIERKTDRAGVRAAVEVVGDLNDDLSGRWSLVAGRWSLAADRWTDMSEVPPTGRPCGGAACTGSSPRTGTARVRQECL
jgi:hypothetical protein